MSTNPTTRSRRRRLLVYAAAGLGTLALLGACSGDSDGPSLSLPSGGSTPAGQPAPEEPAPEQPAPEEPAPEEPAPEQPAPEQPAPEQTAPEQTAEDDGLTTEEWVLLGILAVVVIAIIIGATAAATNHSEKKQAARASLNNQLSQITGMSRWVVDQGSVDILRISDPDQLRSSWNGTRPRIIEVEGQIAVLAGNTGDAGLDQSLNNLGQSVAGLRGSLDTLVSLRTGADAASQQALIDDSARTVQERRQQVAGAVPPVQAAQR